MGTPSSLTITTLDDNGKSIQPTLELAGRALPYQGLELEGSMRAEFTWYPGNAVATVQMLGASEKATTIKGMWKDRFIKTSTDEGTAVQNTGIARFNNAPVADVLDLANKVERMRLSGRLLEFKWDSIVRHGILLRFRQSWVRIEDLEWEMEFQWISRGEPQSPPSLPASVSTDTFAQNMRNLVDAFKSALVPPPELQVVADFTASVQAASEVIEDATLEMQNAAINATSLILAPSAAAEAALAAAKSIQDSAASVVETVETYPPLQLVSSSEPLGLGDALLADSYSRGIKKAAQDIQFLCAGEGETLRASVQQDILLASFIARSPTDLRDVSTQYYGSPDQWRYLMQYNNLSSSLLSVGTLVLVPKITFDPS